MTNFWFGFIRSIATNMETKSPYFSPKKTRNFTKQHGLTLLQKVTQSSKSTVQKNPDTSVTRTTKPKPETDSKIIANITTKEASKIRKRNIRSDAVLSRSTVLYQDEITKLCPLDLEKIPTKQHQSMSTLSIKQEQHETKKDDCEGELPKKKVEIKVDVADEELGEVLNFNTPCKQNTIIHRSPIKRELYKESLDVDDGKVIKWEPKNWLQIMENIRAMRRSNPAPVDTMGCDQFALDVGNIISDRVKRYHCLVSLMLSSQTKDQVNHECMLRLKKHGLTPESIVGTDATILEKLIYPVSFYKNKTKFIKQVSQILIDQYDGDIPSSIEGLLKLPGVGKKMAHLCMRVAWNIVTGIGVDTHVHRISNWLQLVPEETKTPEDTRQALEKWLPFEMWEEVNHMLVGFGQTICTSTFPRCNDCLNASICPARGKHGIRKTPIKKEVKPQDLEF